MSSVDFKKLRSNKQTAAAIDPIEIFRRLPKPQGVNDLYISQAQVLESWYKRRSEKDLVIKLHTGGGKTLVGLLIAQSSLNEFHEPVIYVAPNRQLVDQTIEMAKAYSISALPYMPKTDLPDSFLSGKSILVCVYQALFNAQSNFGVKGNLSKDIVNASTIILDDAHASFSTVRDNFTLSVNRTSEERYDHLVSLFRSDFQSIGQIGTFDDAVSKGSQADYSVLEVPYWSWRTKSMAVREYLSQWAKSEYGLIWAFLRNSFENCHCLINHNSIVITPLMPYVDMIPTFSECKRRIFMSATINDDSAIVRTFDADPESVSKPITSTSLAGVSERLILIPELMPIADKSVDITKTVKGIAKWMSATCKKGTVILVPSATSAEAWKDIGAYADTSEKVTGFVNKLRSGELGPFIFANRYDGIDLPGDTCRLVILSGSPKSISIYDSFRATVFLGSSSISSQLSQKIEQGMGRGARGAGDYCVVILTGKELSAWLSRSSNLKFLTNSSQAQLDIGAEISKGITDTKSLVEVIQKCIQRDRDWIDYHADSLASLTKSLNVDHIQLRFAATERNVLRLLQRNNHDGAIAQIKKFLGSDDSAGLDEKAKGWLWQLAARIADQWGRPDLNKEYQERAFTLNSDLLRPQIKISYIPLSVRRQAESIVGRVLSHHNRRGYLSQYDLDISFLTRTATANQYENSLEALGGHLGFSTERPEKKYGIGPDVLWLANDNLGFVIEAKSRRQPTNPLGKDEHGQLLTSTEWFKQHYPGRSCIGIIAHPNANATNNASAGMTMALTPEKVSLLVADTKSLLTLLCESVVEADALGALCERLLADSELRPPAFANKYLLPFSVLKDA